MHDDDNNARVSRHHIDNMMTATQKAIELKSEMITQNKLIISTQENIKYKIESIIHETTKITDYCKKMEKEMEQTAKDLWKFQILAISGFIAIILQIISIFLKK